MSDSNFPERGIFVYTSYIQICHNIVDAFLLSQIHYWASVSQYQPFYKTNEEFQQELRIGLRQFKESKKRLLSLGFITIEKKGLYNRSYYSINFKKINAAIEKI